jgi:uncharacterized protein (DUF2141 family)
MGGSRNFSLVIALLFFSKVTFGQTTLDINIIGFKNNIGKAYVRVRNESDKIISQKVESITNVTSKSKIELPSNGKYAIEVFHDENNNQKLDTNPVGYPKEAWGTSNNVRPTFRGPSLKEMLFEVTKNSVITIKIK